MCLLFYRKKQMIFLDYPIQTLATMPEQTPVTQEKDSKVGQSYFKCLMEWKSCFMFSLLKNFKGIPS